MLSSDLSIGLHVKFPRLQAEWQATSHISVNAAYVHFVTKGFLKAAGAKDIDFLGVWTSYKF
ncbi:MAG TPA: hypothetical protein VFP79_04815 [Pseudolabrys sp.]|nr:hypothetical protein [Pseudolabrys sp.]